MSEKKEINKEKSNCGIIIFQKMTNGGILLAFVRRKMAFSYEGTANASVNSLCRKDRTPERLTVGLRWYAFNTV